MMANHANPSIRDKNGKFPYEYAEDEMVKDYLKKLTNEDYLDDMRPSEKFKHEI